jgi:hypothetical protein
MLSSLLVESFHPQNILYHGLRVPPVVVSVQVYIILNGTGRTEKTRSKDCNYTKLCRAKQV